MTRAVELHHQVVTDLQRGEAGFGPAKVALVRIAERHTPTLDPDGNDVCGCCIYGDDNMGQAVHREWPCPDFRDVATATGANLEPPVF